MLLDPKRQGEFNMQEFFGVKNTKERRFPEMAACAKALKHDHGFKKVGAIGYCFGGWGVFQLGGKGSNISTHSFPYSFSFFIPSNSLFLLIPPHIESFNMLTFGKQAKTSSTASRQLTPRA